MRSVLIANRGEIACRVIDACPKLGVRPIAVHSDADRSARHVRLADQVVHIGPSRVDRSYLNVEAVLAAAKEAGADAVHPGYGLLSENAGFARAVAAEAGVPILPGSRRFGEIDAAELEALGETIGYPLFVKAAGGGIGMRRVDRREDLAAVVQSTSGMAERTFGNGTVYLERYVPRARHIEVQVFGFGDGRAVHLFERECSIQRRFQKVIEESPLPALDDGIRARMTAAAVALAESQHYSGAATVEFIFDDGTGDFFFLEMNTRIHVEHPVTEKVTGVDLVELQLRLAAGVAPTLSQDDICCLCHAIECRIYAENPARNFLPSAGRLEVAAFPDGGGDVRVDAGFEAGDEITPHYDPLIAKVIVRGHDRADAAARGKAVLGETKVQGVTTNLDLLCTVLDHPAFAAGETFTGFLDVHKADQLAPA